MPESNLVIEQATAALPSGESSTSLFDGYMYSPASAAQVSWRRAALAAFCLYCYLLRL